MKIGDKVFITNVWEEEGNYESNFKERKKAQVLKITGTIIEIITQECIKYNIGTAEHKGYINFNCFLKEEQAIERVNELNNYFNENNYLIK
ncbi:MAG: hypothetical protein RR712_03420 [Terrisporobacter sp.]